MREAKPRSGRPTKTSATTARKIVGDAKKNPQMTSAEMQDSLEKSGVDVSRCTIRRHLKKKRAVWSSHQKKAISMTNAKKIQYKY